MEKLNKILQNKLNLLLIGVVAVLLLGGYFAYNQFTASQQAQGPVEDIEMRFEAEGPFALLVPRRDGNAMILNLTRVAGYDGFSYQLAYTDEEGISRGVGDLDTWVNLEKGKGEYQQEILFGTCSRNVCKYDKGVENGTLTLRLKKGNKAYKFNTLWHLQKPVLTLGAISSGDAHLNIKIDSAKSNLELLGFTIVNDLTGAPKLPESKEVLGRVYAVNLSSSQDFPQSMITIDLADNPPTGAQIAVYSDRNNQWNLLETKVNERKLTAQTNYMGIVTILIPSK
jgi:hypothetical protein